MITNIILHICDYDRINDILCDITRRDHDMIKIIQQFVQDDPCLQGGGVLGLGQGGANKGGSSDEKNQKPRSGSKCYR